MPWPWRGRPGRARRPAHRDGSDDCSGVLVVRLIDDSRSGKAEARANGLASAAASVYAEASRTARIDASSVARLLGTATGHALTSRVVALDAQVGIARVRVTERGRVLDDVGDRSAVAPGLAVLAGHGGRRTGPFSSPS